MLSTSHLDGAWMLTGLSVWWSGAHTYKNAITNELFLFTSASAYLRFGGNDYLANAIKVCHLPRRCSLSMTDAPFDRPGTGVRALTLPT